VPSRALVIALASLVLLAVGTLRPEPACAQSAAQRAESFSDRVRGANIPDADTSGAAAREGEGFVGRFGGAPTPMPTITPSPTPVVTPVPCQDVFQASAIPHSAPARAACRAPRLAVPARRVVTPRSGLYRPDRRPSLPAPARRRLPGWTLRGLLRRLPPVREPRMPVISDGGRDRTSAPPFRPHAVAARSAEPLR
jgi:hypothetical protein